MALTKEAAALLSAALRHVRDAEHLATAATAGFSLDQARHLAGFGPECARKAILSERGFDKLIGHTFNDTALELALSLDPVALRYEPREWAKRYPTLARWSEQCRYDATGAAAKVEPQVRALLVEARDAVDDIVLRLWADGRFSVGVTPW